MSVFWVFLARIFPHSDWIQGDTDQKNSEYGHFSRIDNCIFWSFGVLINKNVCLFLMYHVSHPLVVLGDFKQIFRSFLNSSSSLFILSAVSFFCAPDIMKEIFEIENRNYNFLLDFLIKRCNIRSLYYSTGIASFVGPKIWDTLPNNWKDATSLKSFKVNLKRCTPENCPCRLCKAYIHRVGFL